MRCSIRLLSVFSVFLIAVPVNAIVIRDDVDISQYEAYAKTLPRPALLGRNKWGSANAMGTWISDEWILTAAHAIEKLKTGDKLQGFQELTVVDVVRHPGWRTDHVDLGLIRVKPPQKPVDVVPICNVSDESANIAIVGAGDFGDGRTGPQQPGSALLGAENAIAHLDDRFLLFEFDTPNSGALPLEGVSGPGDSGGPAYRILESGVCLVAVSSGQDSEPAGGQEGRYGVIEFYARADVQSDWIQRVIGGDLR